MVPPPVVVTLAVALVGVQMNCVKTGWYPCVEVVEAGSGPGPGPAVVLGD